MELKQRCEMNAADQWDLTPIFENEADFQKAIDQVSTLCDTLAQYQGYLAEKIENLLACYETVNRASLLVEHIFTYAFLLKSGDGGDAKAQELSGRALTSYMKLSTSTAYIQPEILAIPEETLREWMKDERMADYRFNLSDIIRSRSHTLSLQEEQLLARMSDMEETVSGTFDMLTDVDMTFGEIVDENGEKVQLTQGTFGVYRESTNRKVREAAFQTFFGNYKQYNNTIANLYSGSVKSDWFSADVRHFSSTLEGKLFSGNVPEKVYHSLIEAMHQSFPLMQKYLQLRKEVMQVSSLDAFDLYVPLVGDTQGEYSYEKAKQIVKAALAPLGEAYGKMLDRAFSERWIDVYENKGKASGAFSTGVFGVHPYVLLNYTNVLEDVFTLAHELGHAMHSWYSDTTQPYQNHDYKIMVAEVASTVNEVLLTKYLLKEETDSEKRASILNKLCEGFRTTVFRQTLFAEFELKAHTMYEQGQPLPAQSLNEIYLSLVKQYYEGAEVPEIMQYEWSFVPHFYRAYYVYQYATGFCSAVAIANRIYETGDASDYLRFLTTGGSDYPIEELKIAGVDLTNPQTVTDALKVFDDTIDQLKEILVK